ncbi:acylaminoacyl-peptidase-like protein [Perilla frutescens var. hirtella]|uniref:acylaminoacyl-peptidase n=1 Tax=Perilla frutescens var. hirtella TaxID=608512 RepID=A0AAD4IU18_PERFH|nr:acylaminoacyl-peptidase-like protein [Perilla frutescens var. hirtella]
MDNTGGIPTKEMPVGLDAATQEEFASLSKLLQEFTNTSTIDKAWTFKPENEDASSAMFLISQPDLLSNKRRKSILSSHISRKIDHSVSFHWAPFPIEMTSVSAMVPSPSGSKLLVVRNSEGDSPTRFEIWGPSEVKKEFPIPRSVHRSVYTDGWFEGISWNSEETFIAYAAEEPDLPKPTFTGFGFKKEGATDKDCDSWKGQGDWEEDWGETYSGKRQPALFVIDINSGEVRGVAGVGRELSVGQVVWAPSIDGQQYLVFVGWPSDARKLGIKYCYNRPCALYAVEVPSFKSDTSVTRSDAAKDLLIINLTQSISSAFFPRFSPDGKSLVFLSAKTSVDSGAHSATDSLHKIEWPSNGKLGPSLKITDVVPVVMCPEDGCFPGIYCSKLLSEPWLSDGHTIVLSSIWGSVQTILSVNVSSGQVSRISPNNSKFSWDILALDGDNVIAVCSSPVNIPEIKYGSFAGTISTDAEWSWLDVPSPITKCSEKVRSLLESLQFDIMNIPVKDVSENITKGARKPFEAIHVSSKSRKPEVLDPLIVVLHGGPHTVLVASFSKSLAFLSSLGYSLLIVNYRGSLGFGEEALQSLPGKIGSQDVNDVLTALDYVIDKGLANPSKLFVLGGSHGGFLTTHLIGQAPEKFAAAAARNPVCNLALMVGTSDIPDWCFFEVYGSEGKSTFTESPSAEHLALFHNKSPIAHISKVKTPTLLLLGAQDLRVPVSNGIQYARALKEKGVDSKLIVFPNDMHGIDKSLAVQLEMDDAVGSPTKQMPVCLDAASEEEYASVSKLLQEFTNIPTIDKAWTFKSDTEDGCHAMFLIDQPNLSSNEWRKSILSSHILHTSDNSVSFQWARFPIELTGVSAVVPSPSGSKLLVIRNSEGDSPTHFEIWDSSGVEKDFAIPSSIHGTVYLDGWFEGISWNLDETGIAYIAEEPDRPRPTFNGFGYKKGGTSDTDYGSWKGQGDWEEDWGETYAGKRQPALFVLDVDSGAVLAVTGVGRELSVGQVVWAPSMGSQQYLVFVGWPSDSRKFGVKYCSNRPCALYAIKAPLFGSIASVIRSEYAEDFLMVNLTQSISSALFPRFSPDGKFLVFLSTRSSVDSGAHLATESLHKIEWPSDGKLGSSLKIFDVVRVVMCPEDGCFPGLYCSKFLTKPWLSDGRTMVLSSVWGSTQTILSVDVLSGKVSRISPKNSKSSWDVLALDDDDNIIAVCSSPINVPEIKYGRLMGKNFVDATWSWLDVSTPTTKCREKALSLLASLKFDIMKIPVRNVSENLTEGARKPFEAIFVSSKSKKPGLHDPLIVILHGGPHDVSLTTFSKSSAFLCSLGYSLLIVNYRGSLGFGEEALQSLPGKVGSQDVNDVLTAIDHVIDKGVADPSKIAVVGLSHGGFLTTHLIGQAPEKFAAAVARNPVCNFALMVGTTDIPDWCFFEAFGSEAKSIFTSSPSAEHLALFYSKSPISHVSKVKTPTLFLLGAKDLRVPVYDGMQYARALKERGVETKIIMFPDDVHAIKIPRSDFESFLNIGVWFNKYCK